MKAECEGVAYLHAGVLAITDGEGEASEESPKNLWYNAAKTLQLWKSSLECGK